MGLSPTRGLALQRNISMSEAARNGGRAMPRCRGHSLDRPPCGRDKSSRVLFFSTLCRVLERSRDRETAGGSGDIGDRDARKSCEILLPFSFGVAGDGDDKGHFLAVVEAQKKLFIGVAAMLPRDLDGLRGRRGQRRSRGLCRRSIGER